LVTIRHDLQDTKSTCNNALTKKFRYIYYTGGTMRRERIANSK
jgi:hypothetical protein